MIKQNNGYSVTYSAFLLAVLFFSGCTGSNSFGVAARSGDTIALALGWQKELKKEDLQITFTDSNSATFHIPAGDPALVALVNAYPDPVSKYIVGSETGVDLSGNNGATGLLTTIIDFRTTNDRDITETILWLEIPSGLSPGNATIEIADDTGNPILSAIGEAIQPMSINILPGSGAGTSPFQTQEGANLNSVLLSEWERASNTAVTFQGTQIPHAIEIDFQHGPDIDNNGVGRAYVVPPRGDLLNIDWHDNGTSLKAILSPARGVTFTNIKKFRFYISGGITGLSVQNLSAFDINGAPVENISYNLN